MPLCLQLLLQGKGIRVFPVGYLSPRHAPRSGRGRGKSERFRAAKTSSASTCSAKTRSACACNAKTRGARACNAAPRSACTCNAETRGACACNAETCGGISFSFRHGTVALRRGVRAAGRRIRRHRGGSARHLATRTRGGAEPCGKSVRSCGARPCARSRTDRRLCGEKEMAGDGQGVRQPARRAEIYFRALDHLRSV